MLFCLSKHRRCRWQQELVALPGSWSPGHRLHCPCRTGWAASALHKHQHVPVQSSLAPLLMQCLVFLFKIAAI